MVLAGEPGPSALIMKSTPSPLVRCLAHGAVAPSSSACTSMRSGASALTRVEQLPVAAGAENARHPHAKPEQAAPRPSVPLMPSTSMDWPATAFAFFIAP